MSKQPKKQKRTKPKSRVKKSPIQILNLFIIVLVVVLLGIITNTFIDDELSEDSSTKATQKEEKFINKVTTLENNYEEKTNALKIEYNKANNQPIEHKKLENKTASYTFLYDENETKEPILLEENHHIETVTIKETPIEPKSKEVKKENIEKSSKKSPVVSKKPKLAIIIDDVSFLGQVKKIKNVRYPITMAFLPPTNGHKNSAKIAKGLPFYMIHLPLEASTRKYEESDTIHIGDSKKFMEKRIAKIHNWYPDTKYINNHTGSKFTSDYASMDKLFSVLKKYNYIFLDSKTTPDSVVKQLAKKHGIKYLTRNIFLDNKIEKDYILKQLKKAIKIAKNTGQAIAIGHPHSTTIETLKNATHLFDGLELVYVNQL
jgi:uncharacterized protein